MTTATLSRSDPEIQKDVIAEPRWEVGVQPSDIGVAVKDGVVTLAERVDTFLVKWKPFDLPGASSQMTCSQHLSIASIPIGDVNPVPRRKP
jgi:hypothetical protein